MNFRVALTNDLKQIEAILKQSDLPYEDCAEHLENFLVVENLDEVVGVGGLELYGNIALLRSIAVIKKYRGQRVGGAVYQKIKDKALTLGVKELFLLTETAEEYFETLGFHIVDRSSVPQPIKQTKQFSSLCPSSAVVMKHTM